jgi:hypothetical protein
MILGRQICLAPTNSAFLTPAQISGLTRIPTTSSKKSGAETAEWCMSGRGREEIRKSIKIERCRGDSKRK